VSRRGRQQADAISPFDPLIFFPGEQISRLKRPGKEKRKRRRQKNPACVFTFFIYRFPA
jgi:hypothetical protein